MGSDKVDANNLSAVGADDTVDDDDSSWRLARNRATARLRREKKKQEAERLTCETTEAKMEYNSLMESLNVASISEDTRKEILDKVQQEAKLHPKGCLFCDRTFEHDKNVDLIKHVHSDHATELKNFRVNLGQAEGHHVGSAAAVSKYVDLEVEVDYNLNLDVLFNRLDFKSKTCQSSGNSFSSGESESGEQYLTEEEKKRVRLQRNAESARLCRQRKKLYTQKLRLDLPKIRFKNALLKHYLQPHLPVNEPGNINGPSSVEKNKPTIPKLSGWDHTEKRYKIRPSELEPKEEVTSEEISRSFKKQKVNTQCMDAEQNQSYAASTPPAATEVQSFPPLGYGFNPNVGQQFFFSNYMNLMNLNRDLNQLALLNGLLLNSQLLNQNLSTIGIVSNGLSQNGSNGFNVEGMDVTQFFNCRNLDRNAEDSASTLSRLNH